MNRTNNTLQTLRSGFTLIELLVVIAIIGVLAGAIMVAINPLEQIARAEDAGRKDQTTQLANAMQAYIVAQGRTDAPPVGVGLQAGVSNWQTMLMNGGEIKRTFVAPTGATACGPAANNETGYCYAPDGTTGNYFIWTFLEAATEVDKAEGTEGAGAAGSATDADQICNGTNRAAYLFSSAQGKGGNICLSTTTVPTGTLVLY